jgi:ABC-type transport system substrate-binding protein
MRQITFCRRYPKDTILNILQVEISYMNMKVLLGGIAFLMLLLLVAGCTQTTAPQTTPVPTTEPTTAVPVTTATAVSTTFVPATPGPTDTLQSNWAVNVQVQSNGQAINPQVIFTFNGGMGQNLIPEIDVMLIRSDGTVETGNMTQPLSIGQTVSLPGTTGNNDRAEVWVISPQGDRVKIYDQYVPFRSYH